MDNLYLTVKINLASSYQLYVWLNTRLWSGAKQRWDDATQLQKEAVMQRIADYFVELDETELNDFIWFECDDIFFPEDEKEGD